MTRASFIRDDRPLSRNLWWEGKGDVFRKRHQVSTMGGIGGDPREGDPTDGSQRKRRQHGVSARSPMHAADGGNPVNDEQSRSSDPSSRSSSLLSPIFVRFVPKKFPLWASHGALETEASKEIRTRRVFEKKKEEKKAMLAPKPGFIYIRSEMRE